MHCHEFNSNFYHQLYMNPFWYSFGIVIVLIDDWDWEFDLVFLLSRYLRFCGSLAVKKNRITCLAARVPRFTSIDLGSVMIRLRYTPVTATVRPRSRNDTSAVDKYERMASPPKDDKFASPIYGVFVGNYSSWNIKQIARTWRQQWDCNGTLISACHSN